MPQKGKTKIIKIAADFEPSNITSKSRNNIKSPKKSSPKKPKKSPKKGPKKYDTLPLKTFCGKAGGYDDPRKFPVNSPARCSNALSRAHLAPNPKGIRTCAIKKAKEHGWEECGKSNPKNKK